MFSSKNILFCLKDSKKYILIDCIYYFFNVNKYIFKRKILYILFYIMKIFIFYENLYLQLLFELLIDLFKQ